ncbi:nucleoside/nucleotide kinase family protein [Microbacterium mangrovi]|uniref:hypothetical protein n=1 Tax=Microbacterium mangrovi TaxID=1348253 RepID=UPI0009DE3E37|nr:hypothetical protein [Microbacterium mangrovi]
MSSAPARSERDPVRSALGRAVAGVVDAVRAQGVLNPVILIDGRSGSGKSTLARAVVASWPLHGRVQLVALDSLYPGWDGLAEGVETARASILYPHARGTMGVWQRWDWEASVYAEAHAVDPSLPLIVEGSGILTSQTAALSDIRVWLESPETSRRTRALERDGETYRPHWDRWSAQERAHVAADEPQKLATLRFDVP